MTDHRAAYRCIQVLRGIAALLVVVFHLRIVEAGYGNGAPVLPEAATFADGGVDLFFVISGFVMTAISAQGYRSPSNAIRFLLRRGLRIIPLYWFYTTLVVILMAVVPSIVNTSYQGQEIVASYLLLPQRQLSLLTVGWTLVHEAYFYIVLALAIAFIRERLAPVFLAIWAVIICTAQIRTTFQAPWEALVFNAMTLEFIAGAFIGLFWRRLPANLSVPCLITGALAFAGAMAALPSAAMEAHAPLARTMVFGTASALIVLGAVTRQGKGNGQWSGWLVAIGDSSYSLYLSHVFVVSAAARAWRATGLVDSPWQHGAFVVFTLLACIVTGIASYLWIERPVITATRGAFRPVAFRATRSGISPP